MSHFKCEGRLDFLSIQQKKELTRQFKRPKERAMPHQLAARLGLPYSSALAILSVLETDKLCEIRLLIYHRCTEAPVGAIPFGKGFPHLPWICPHCEDTIESQKELSFDLMAITIDVIEFV